jgi:tetratricopeptide (TPR) repeat protein
LGEALQLWRGPALGDLAYEEFAQADIGRLEEERLAALEDRIEVELGLGQHAVLVAELDALVGEHPMRERFLAQLMLALYRCGRQADALEYYRRARERLVGELGIEPGPALRDLEARILSQDAGLEAPAVASVRSAGPGEARPAGAESVSSRERVVGRGEQIDQLRSGLDAAVDGRGVVFMISGEAGIGKTRLADELAREARGRGAQVVWGRCWEVGGAPAYWPWVQVLRSLLHGRNTVDLRSFRGAGADSLRALIPELASEPVSSTPESESARFQLFDAVALLLRESAEDQPLVIVLDDLHAADTPSLLLLQFLAGQLEDVPVMLAGLHRDDDPSEDGALNACLAALAREHATTRIRLTGLSVGDTTAMIEAITDRPVRGGVAHRIYSETEGNPLFIAEIIRLLEAEGSLERQMDEPSGRRQLPDTVREVIGQRLRRLTPDCRRLLGEASVLGREFAVKELAAVAESGEDAVLEAFDEGVTARVLSAAPALGRLRFSHALVRDTLYEGLDAPHRRAAHLRAGAILERLYASDPESHLAELAHHFCAALPAGDAARAVDHAGRAGDRAVALLAYEEAARLYELALGALDLQEGDAAETRGALLVALGDARARAGDEPAARDAFLQAAAIAARAGMPVHHAQAALGYGGRFVWSRSYGDVHLIPLLEAALQSLPAEHAALRARLMARLSGALRDHPSRERRASLSAQAVQIARELGDPATLAYALDGRCSAILWPDTPEERLDIAKEIVELATGVKDDERAIMGRFYRAIANMELGRMSDVEPELEGIAQAAADLRQPAQLWMTAASRAGLALFQGRFEDARTLIAEALTLGERAQSKDSVLSHRLQLFLLHRETGAREEARTVLADAVAQFPSRPVFRCALACLDADRGDTDAAQAAVDELSTDDFAAIQRDNEYLFSLAFLADAIGELRDVRSAAVLYDLLLPFAHLNSSNLDEVATGSVSRSLGVLAATTSRWQDALHHFDEAITRNTDMGARPWVAHSQHDHARMLLDRGEPGDRDRARPLLGEARDTYERLGMSPWTARVAEALALAG